jgi:hypothetical protein
MENAIVRLAENTTLLHKICDKPTPPTFNTRPIPDHRDSRSFPFDDEVEIVSCLSYLSSYSDSPERVSAICLEETLHGQSMRISVATNTGSTSYLEQGLRRIADTLERQAIGKDARFTYDHPKADRRRPIDG